MSKWLFLTDTITISKFTDLNFMEKKFFSANVTSITKNEDRKYSILFQDMLYQIGVIINTYNGIVFLKHKYTELSKYFSKSNNLSLFLGYITS